MRARVAAALPATALLVCGAAAVASEPRLGVRPCDTRIETGRPIGFGGRHDVVVGRVAFSGLARIASPAELARWRLGPARYEIKSVVVVRAGPAVMVSVAPRFRRRLALEYVQPTRAGVPWPALPAVRLEPCPPDTPAFVGGGTVGRLTAFSGGFRVRRPGCYVLEARSGSESPVRRTISFGAGRAC
jgi:hypothetical protein